MSEKVREAAGVFLYRINGEGRAEFLLLRSAAHGAWGVPKGHRDPEDVDLLACALREVEEETGLEEFLLHSGFRQDITYQATRHSTGESYPKRVCYFLGRKYQGRVEVSEEHDAEGWFEESKARTLLKFANLIEVFDNACEFLNTQCNVSTGKDLE